MAVVHRRGHHVGVSERREDGRSLEEPSDSEGFAAAFLTTLFCSGAFTVDEGEAS